MKNKPTIGQEYYYIGRNLCVQETVYAGANHEDEQIEHGNYFPKDKYSLSEVAQLCAVVQREVKEVHSQKESNLHPLFQSICETIKGDN